MCLSEKFVKVITEFEVHKSILENDTDNWHWDIYILSFRTSRIKKKKIKQPSRKKQFTFMGWNASWAQISYECQSVPEGKRAIVAFLG